MQNWKNLDIWKEAYELRKDILKLVDSRNYPKNELYNAAQQIKNCSSSVCANIVEGASRKDNKQFLPYLWNAMGSLQETEFWLLDAKDNGWILVADYNSMQQKIEKLAKMLNVFIQKVSGKYES